MTILGVDALSFASVFANSLIIIFAGAICAYTGLSLFFPLRRRPAYVFWSYFLLKCAIWAFYDTAFFFGLRNGALQASWAVIVAVMSIITYGVLYATWNTSLLKIGLVAVLVDSTAGLCTAIVLPLAGLLFPGEPSTNYVFYLGPRTFFTAVVLVPTFALVIRLAAPIGRFICNLKFRNERLLTPTIMIILVLIASTKSQEISLDGAIWAYTMLTIVVALLVPYAIWSGRKARKRRVLLARTQALMRAYDGALHDQAEFLAESRLLLDDLSERISSASRGASAAYLAEHLEALRASCDKLRFGTYSDNPALDVTLVSWENRLKPLGIPVEYRVAPLAESGSQAAIVVQSLLEWAFAEYGGADSDARPGSETSGRLGGRLQRGGAAKGDGLDGGSAAARDNAAGGVRFRIFRRANQLFIEMRAAGLGKLKFPRSRVAEHLPAPPCFVSDFREGQDKVVRAIVVEERA